MISVIVPVYNTEKYLDRCIQSILSQTYIDFELLLINDGSTDSSGVICDKYAEQDSRVRVFHKENGGVSSARNIGLDNANGDWIAFVDSDDWVYPCWLENYDITNNSTYDLICQGVECSKGLSINDPCKSYSFDFAGTVKDGLLLLYKYHIVGYLFIKLFKKNVIEKYKIRFDERLKFKEDEVFVLNYMMHCEKMLSSNKVGYYYYVPDWDKKYIKEYKEYTQTKTSYEICNKIFNCEMNILTTEYINSFTDSFYYRLDKGTSFRDQIKTMIDFRETLGNRVLNTRIFLLLKWIIYLDKTGYISAVMFNIHNFIKRESLRYLNYS